MSAYVAHLADDRYRLFTACGEPWQGWQAPVDLDLKLKSSDPRAMVLPPHNQPRPHEDAIRQCQACLRVAMTAAEQERRIAKVTEVLPE
jgi:hypothetical protein